LDNNSSGHIRKVNKGLDEFMLVKILKGFSEGFCEDPLLPYNFSLKKNPDVAVA